MITIRLTRTGRKNQPSYRIAIANTKSKRDGKMIEYVGFYNTKTNPNTIKLNHERIKYWLSQGAQVSSTVKHLLIKEKLIKKDKEVKKYNNKPGKKKQAKMEKSKIAEKPKVKPEVKTDTKAEAEENKEEAK